MSDLPISKPHKGVIIGRKIYVPGGSILIGWHERTSDNHVVIRMTSLIVKEDGPEVETLYSRYTFYDEGAVYKQTLFVTEVG